MSPAASIQLSQPVQDVKLVRSGDPETLRGLEVKAAYERGRIEGERAVGEQLIRQRAEVMELQTGVLTALRNVVPQVTRDCERTLIALALEIAQKLVAGMPVSAEMIEASVRESIAQVEDGAEFTVQVHPEDLAALERINSPLLLPQGGRDRVRFHGSTQVTRGGCIVQTRFGLIDGRRETRLQVLENVLAP
jgi:flagellar biosynthesis/type III secretory pathway protein FliH